MFGNHDISHCLGGVCETGTTVTKECPVRDTCHRYLMYLDAVEKKLNYISITLPNKIPCQLRWEINSKL